MTLLRAVAVCALPLVAACDVKVNEGGVSLDISQGRASDEWTRTYDLAPGGRLEIENVNGRIEASLAAGSQVEIVAQREVTANSDEAAEDALKKLQIVEEVTQGRVKLGSKSESDQPFSARGRSRVRINYRVSIPAGLEVSLKNDNGGIRVSDVQGRVTASSTNGQINVERLSGTIDAVTVNGAIDLDLSNLTGDLRAETVNGGVRIAVPADLDATIDARAVNGGVRVDEALRLNATARERLRVAGTLNAGGPKISAQTTNGGVRIMARGASDSSREDRRLPELAPR